MRSSPSPTAEDGSTVTATLAVKVIMNTIPKKHQKSEPVGGSTGIIIPTLGGSDLLNFVLLSWNIYIDLSACWTIHDLWLIFPPMNFHLEDKCHYCPD